MSETHREEGRVANDWYPGSIPANVSLAENVYVDTSYAFDLFSSEQRPGLILGDACGVYDRTTFVVGPAGRVTIGAYTCLNGTYLICNDRMTIGSHCFFAWGVVLTDTWLSPAAPLVSRRRVLHKAAADPRRRLPAVSVPLPVVVEDAVWVGFDAVILPGVRLGRGCVVGCRSVVMQDVAPYAVVAGDPARVVRFLAPTDTDAAREEALQTCVRA